MSLATAEDLKRARRVLTHGATGAGKSTAAVRIGEILDLPVHLADEEIGFLPASEAVWTNRETLGQALSRDSIIVWHFTSFARKRATMRTWAQDPAGPPTILVGGPAELDRLMEQISG